MAFGRHQKPGRGFVFSGNKKGQPDYASDAEAATEIKRLIGTPEGGGGGGGGGGSTLELTDGTHDITGVTKITTPVADLVVGGSTPNATLDLANTAVTPATYGDATHVGQFIVDAKGRITGATSIAITYPSSPVGANPTAQVGPSAVNGSATTFLRSDGAPKLADTTVTPATYGDSSHYATFTVDQQGRLTAAASVSLPAGATGANPTATGGDVAINGSATTYLRSDGAFAIQKSSASLFGLAKVDGTTILASAGVISTPGGANPSATASDTAVNGSAATFMRSDAAPAIQKASSSAFGLAKVDNVTITASGGVISATGTPVGGAMPPICWTVGLSPGFSSAADATKGNLIKPLVNFSVTKILAYVAAISPETFFAGIYVVNSSLVIQSVVATSASQTPATGNQTLVFPCAANLVAGTLYAIVITRTDGTGTSSCPLAGNTQTGTIPFVGAPLDTTPLASGASYGIGLNLASIAPAVTNTFAQFNGGHQMALGTY